MKKNVLLSLFFGCIAAVCASAAPRESERASAPLSDRVVNYVIDADLDVEAKKIHGRERLRWRNPSKEPVGDLQFHLYLNAFRDNKSTFMRESGGQLRGDRMDPTKLGSIEITSMKTRDGEELASRGEFIHPDDDNADDHTVWRVALSRPVAPGAEIELDIAFTAKLPRVFARTGYFGNYFFVGQWFPKIGVYEPAGMRRRATSGWNCHQFHADTEFYADFGTYDVTCTVPEGFKIGATGALREKRAVGNGRAAYRFLQDDVHDFAWTCSPDFLEFFDDFNEPGLHPVRIQLLLQPENASAKERCVTAVKNALRFFGERYGEYPYDTLTVVDPAHNADGSGGMEYPTLITGANFFSPLRSDEAQTPYSPEVVLIHEFGHQYWYGMVASNEFEESWMDEGVNTYTENEALDAFYYEKQSLWLRFGGAPLFKFPMRVRDWDVQRAQLSAYAVKLDPIVTPAWKYRRSYGFNSYVRPALTLKMLEAHIGRSVMARVMKTYFERWKFKHPTSQDFFDVASEISGQNLDWFFEQYFKTTKVLDYSARLISPTEAAAIRVGDAVMPVEIEVRFADGTAHRETWDGKDQEKRIVMERQIVCVIVDPENKLWMDVNQANNSQAGEISSAGSASLTSRVIFFLQNFLQGLAVFG
jgi:hypothetical protein